MPSGETVRRRFARSRFDGVVVRDADDECVNEKTKQRERDKASSRVALCSLIDSHSLTRS
jgi:hypothetical protein